MITYVQLLNMETAGVDHKPPKRSCIQQNLDNPLL